MPKAFTWLPNSPDSNQIEHSCVRTMNGIEGIPRPRPKESSSSILVPGCRGHPVSLRCLKQFGKSLDFSVMLKHSICLYTNNYDKITLCYGTIAQEYALYSRTQHTDEQTHTQKGTLNKLPYSESVNFFSGLSSSFAARLPVALYREPLVDQIKQPTQHTLIFATTLAYLPSYLISPPQIFLLFPSLPFFLLPSLSSCLILKCTFHYALFSTLSFFSPLGHEDSFALFCLSGRETDL